MYSLLISLLSAVLVTEGIHLAFPRTTWGLILPALASFVGVAALLLRRSARQVEPLVKAAEKHIAGNRRELAVKTLREGLSLGKWNPLLPGQMRVQIGVLEYATGNLEAAEAELSRASRYPWLSRAYLGCIYFRKHDTPRMKKAFATALKVGEKEGILYTLYAHCLIAQGQRDEAVKVLERGLKKIKGDNRLEANLALAKEGKKLKTAPYGDAWTRFGLEGGPTPLMPASVPKFMRGQAIRPGFRQKPQRRK